MPFQHPILNARDGGRIVLVVAIEILRVPVRWITSDPVWACAVLILRCVFSFGVPHSISGSDQGVSQV